MRVFVFSYIRLFVEALSVSLMKSETISEVKTCHEANKLIKEVVNNAPDIMLVDINIAAAFIETRSVCHALPKLPVIAISAPEIEETVIACADAGFFGYVPREASVDVLLSNMHMALKGECLCNAKITASLFREIRNRQKLCEEQLVSEPLTRRECEILRLVSLGHSNKQIANQLILSVATVKNHIHNIFSKYHVHSRSEILGRLRNEPWIVNSG